MERVFDVPSEVMDEMLDLLHFDNDALTLLPLTDLKRKEEEEEEED